MVLWCLFLPLWSRRVSQWSKGNTEDFLPTSSPDRILIIIITIIKKIKRSEGERRTSVIFVADGANRDGVIPQILLSAGSCRGRRHRVVYHAGAVLASRLILLVFLSWSLIFFSISASVSVSSRGHHWSASPVFLMAISTVGRGFSLKA